MFGMTGCALPVRTQGVTGPVSWSATAFDLDYKHSMSGDRDRFSFVLVLHETQGRALTLNAVTWEVIQTGVELSGRQTRAGSWSLPPHGTLRQPFIYRINCPPTYYCPNMGSTTQWDIVFEGQDDQGQPVRLDVHAELPWIPPRHSETQPAFQQEPSVELPPIDITSSRLYYPIYETD
jgi:hypothetical protein